MMQNMKKTLAALLALLTLFGAPPYPAAASENTGKALQSEPFNMPPVETGEGEGGKEEPAGEPMGIGPLDATMVTASFYNWDDDMNPLCVTTVEEGGNAAYQGAAPERAEHVFTGWHPSLATPLTADTRFTAQFRPAVEKTYQVIVYYMFQNGSEAAKPYTASLALGGSFLAPSPAVQGFVPDMALVSGVIDAQSKPLTVITVTYSPSVGTSYVVRHYQRKAGEPITPENAQDRTKYEMADIEDLNAITGADVTVEPKEYAGFSPLEGQKLTHHIAADGTTVIDVFYTRDTYALFFLAAGGVYVEPLFKEYGEALTAQELATATTRFGFAFAGWDKPVPAAMPLGGDTLTAVWTPTGTADYTIVHLVENLAGDGYNLHSTETRNAVPDTPIVLSGTDAKAITGFTYDRYDEGKKVTADGATAICLYYTRNTYTIEFRWSNRSQEGGGPAGALINSITAKYQADIKSQWAAAAGGVPYANQILWSLGKINGASPWTTLVPTMPGENQVYYSYTTSGMWYTRVYRAQNLDTSGLPINNSYTNFLTVSRLSVNGSGEYVTYTTDYPDIPGYKRDDPTSANGWYQSGGDYRKNFPDMGGTLTFNYYPLQYTVTRMNGSQSLPASSFYFSADISKLGETEPTSPPSVPSGYTFKGWYENPSFVGNPYDFQGKKMPADNLIFYAYWAPPTHLVSFYTADGAGAETLHDTAEVVVEGYATAPASPARQGYTFKHWSLRATPTVPYQFDNQPIMQPTDLVAQWAPRTDLSYTVHYWQVGAGWQTGDPPGANPLPGVSPNPKIVTGQRLGSTAHETAPVAPNYVANLVSKAVTLTGDPAKDVIDFNYKTYTTLSYVVHYVDDQGNALTDPKVEDNHTGSSVITEHAPTILGYSPVWMRQDFLLSADSTANVFEFVYTPNEAATYKVEYYYTNLATGKYNSAPDETETLSGFAGLPVTAEQRAQNGYAFDAANSTSSGFVEAGGGLLLRMYYRRSQIAWTVLHQRFGTDIMLAASDTGAMLLGETLTATEKAIGGYEWVSANKQLVIGSDPALNVITLYYRPNNALAVEVTAEPAYASVGDSITFSASVKNTGPENLTGVVVTDPLMSAPWNIGALAAGATVSTSYAHTVTPADATQGYVRGAPAAVGFDIINTEVKGSGQAEALINALNVSKSADKTLAAVGESVQYTIEVKNTSANTLYGVQATDPLMGPDWDIGVLAAGQAAIHTYTCIVREADMMNSIIHNTVTVAGRDAQGREVMNQAEKDIHVKLVVTAKPQSFVYNDAPQGTVGEGLAGTMVAVTGLNTGDYVDIVTLSGSKQTLPGVYADTLAPSGAVILSSAGEDVTGNYADIEYRAGTLTIQKKGSGETGPGGEDGEELPLVIAAREQTYVYTGQPQGKVGASLQVDGANPVAEATGLLPGHRLASVGIGGTQLTQVGTTAITPHGAKIVNAGDADVTEYYEITEESYVASTLNIVQYTGENVGITAEDQLCVYDGSARGVLGPVDPGSAEGAAAVTASGLLTGHRLAEAVLESDPAAPCVEPGAYALRVTSVKIVDGAGLDVTPSYGLTSKNFVPGTLTIQKKGGGTDPETGEELPLSVQANKQSYVYDGGAKGEFGVKAGAEAASLATALELLPGDVLASVTLSKRGAEDAIDAGAYANEIVPSAVQILRGAEDVTQTYYLLTAESYIAGDLVIEPKGGTTDPETGEQTEIQIAALTQTYEYDGQAHGAFGAGLTDASLAQATGLIPGHRLAEITLSGARQTEPTSYFGEIVPSNAVIRDGSGADVTKNYKIEAASYVAGDLVITKKGFNGTPLRILAQDQHFTYNGALQGDVDTTLSGTAARPAALAEGLLPGDYVQSVYIAGTQQSEPGEYPGSLMPSNARIAGASGADRTAHYDIAPASYVAGALTIHKKGGGETDPETGGEKPLTIAAADQIYAYNGFEQGVVGVGLDNGPSAPLVTAHALIPGHRIARVDILGDRWAQVTGANPRPLTPANAVIVDGSGADVTANYHIDPRSYVAGALHIVGAQGTSVRIAALDQRYVYDGTLKGTLGTVEYDAAAPEQVVSVTGLFHGDRLAQVTLSGARQTEPGDYPLIPAGAKIMRGDADVTANYGLTADNYAAGTMTIQKRGAGVDGEGRSIPLTIQAKNQSYAFTGMPQGDVGLKSTADQAAAVVEPLPEGVLLPGDSLSGVRISGAQRTYPTEPASVLTPGEAQITDADGNDRNDYYLLDAASGEVDYQTGQLTIRKRGDGNVDPETGGEGAPVIRAKDQEYTYNGAPQGIAGPLTVPAQIGAAIEAELAPGHSLSSVTVTGGPQTDAGAYALIPSDARILFEGQDVTQHYEDFDYQAGSLRIDKLGTGGAGTDVIITAADQAYVYDGTAKGVVGLQAEPSAAVATAQGLAATDRLQRVVIGAPAERVAPGGYDLLPQQAAIYNGDTDVTHNYDLTSANYQKGTLTIHKAGGPGDPNPIVITTKDQRYVYNKQPQGVVGVIQNDLDAVVTVTGLPAGHTLRRVTIDGAQQVLPTASPVSLTPRDARIFFGGIDVTDRFDLAGAYVPGALTVDKKGGGIDPETGAQRPLSATAKDQAYLYNGKPQGKVGVFTALTADKPEDVAHAPGLLPGDRLAGVTIGGVQLTDAGVTALTPSGIVIRDRDGAGDDVTGAYNITGETYRQGTLSVQKAAITVKPLDQHYTYDGAFQGGGTGALMPHDAKNPLVALAAGSLMPGHAIDWVGILSSAQRDPGEYRGAIRLAEARIFAGGSDVTGNYDVTYGADATLYLHKKGSGETDPETGGEKPLTVTAKNQRYLYDETPHGVVGNFTESSIIARHVEVKGLLPGHAVKSVTIDGAQETVPGAYPLTPRDIVIVDQSGNQAQQFYLITPASYVSGNLVIYKKGSGETDPETGLEKPVRIIAADQSYVYDGTAQGVVGGNLSVDAAKPLATVQELLPGHRLASITISGQPRTEPGEYPNALIPSSPVIVDQHGRDVTHGYLIAPSSFAPGTLTVHKKGSGSGGGGDGPEDPLIVRALDQNYVYSGAAQGRVGNVIMADDPSDPVAAALGLLPGHALYSVTIDGARRTDPGTYPNALRPSEVRIVDQAGADVTRFYHIAEAGFQPGALTIGKKGNGDRPLYIAALEQTYPYTGNARGKFGEKLKCTPDNPYVVTIGLMPGDQVRTVSLRGTRKVAAGRYESAITPADVVIVNAFGVEVTDNYWIVPESYFPGDLVITEPNVLGTESGDGVHSLGIDPRDPFKVYTGITTRDTGDCLE